MEINFYKDLLVIEMSKKDRLDNEYSNNTFLMITALISVDFFFFEKYNGLKLDSPCYKTVNTFVLLLLFVSLVGCLFYFIRAYNNMFNGNDYQSLPDIKKVRELDKANIQNINYFNEDLTDVFSESISSYQQINIRRFSDFYNCRKWIIALFLFTILYISIYYFIY